MGGPGGLLAHFIAEKFVCMFYRAFILPCFAKWFWISSILLLKFSNIGYQLALLKALVLFMKSFLNVRRYNKLSTVDILSNLPAKNLLLCVWMCVYVSDRVCGCVYLLVYLCMGSVCVHVYPHKRTLSLSGEIWNEENSYITFFTLVLLWLFRVFRRSPKTSTWLGFDPTTSGLICFSDGDTGGIHNGQNTKVQYLTLPVVYDPLSLTSRKQ